MVTQAITRDEKGRFIKGGDNPYKIVNSAQGHAKARARWDKVAEEAEKGAMQAAKEADPDLREAPLAWVAPLVKARAAVALSGSERGGNDAARFVMQAANAWPADRPAAPGGGQHGRPVALLALLMREVDAFDNDNYQNHDVVDGQAVDCEEVEGE